MRLLTFALFITATLGAPLIKRNTLSAKNLISINPASLSCSDTTASSECRTASQAASNLAASFAIFDIEDFNTQAALVALVMYESDNFQYSQNHYPGVAGQGTRNMQSASYNAQYARFLSRVQSSGITATDFENAQARGPSATLALVNTDLWSFASASWFLTTQCSQAIRDGLAQGTQAGWSSYLTQCIGTTASNDRNQVWDKVKSLGQWSS